MGGKCFLFKVFEDMYEVTIFVCSKFVKNIVNVVKFIAGSFSGINLENISIPHCFEIERRLKKI
jgi:malate dehydrogenase (oxaloacetate-decarboxylating)